MKGLKSSCWLRKSKQRKGETTGTSWSIEEGCTCKASVTQAVNKSFCYFLYLFFFAPYFLSVVPSPCLPSLPPLSLLSFWCLNIMFFPNSHVLSLISIFSFPFFSFPMLCAPILSLCFPVLLSVSQYMLCIFSHHVAYKAGVIHSLSSVFSLRRITVKSNSLKKMLRKLSQRPSQLVLLLKRYVLQLFCLFSKLPSPCCNTSFTLFPDNYCVPKLICNRELLPRSRTSNLKVCKLLFFFYPCCCMHVMSYFQVNIEVLV